MVLESTIVCVDNSEFMRNGDFVPSRLQAQQEAVSLVCHAKLRSNPENNVALLSMAGDNPQVLTTLTTDVGRVLGKLHQVKINGETNLLTGIKIAHLALKHRQGKNHKMRIVAFIGSPLLQTDEKELVKMAKKLKKEKVNVDIVNFGEELSNTDKLYSFIKVLEGTSSHMVTVPSGSLLSDALYSSPVILGEDGSGLAAAGLGSSGFEFGIDPNEDPELALALRVSMEEQRQRQEEEARQQQQAAASAASASVSDTQTTSSLATTGETAAATAPASASASASEKTTGEAKDSAANKTTTDSGSSEEEMLEKALAMSLEPMDSSDSATGAGAAVDISRMTEDEQIQYAMQMSLQASSSDKKNDKDKDKEEPMDTDDK